MAIELLEEAKVGSNLRVVIRADASVQIGSGHVMRCLTLADALRERGAEVYFVCRDLLGHLGGVLANKYYPVHWLLAPDTADAAAIPACTTHSAWLGVTWKEDAEQMQDWLATLPEVDWLIVDHYALDQAWESQLRPQIKRIMVIDDLADRPHDCDLLVDQNYSNPIHTRYRRLVPEYCELLIGSLFAMVRSEFSTMRSVALARRNGDLHRALLFMGGSDPTNETGKVLAGLRCAGLTNIIIDVAIGIANPHRAEIEEICNHLPNTYLHVQTPHMAELMARADCAICAGGSVTWERCVLGLPAVVTILSENQAATAEALAEIGGHRLLGWSDQLTVRDYTHALTALTPESLRRMSVVSSGLCDGQGAARVVNHLLQ